MERLRYFIKNCFWMFIHMLVTSLFPFFIRFFMIRKWGIEYLGINGFFTSILQVLNIAELGMGSAILYSMYKPMAEHDHSTVNALLNLYRKIYNFLGVVILCIGLLILPFISRLISGECPEDIDLYVVYLIQLANLVLGYVVKAYWDAVPRTNQRIDAIYKIGVVATTVMYGSQILIICQTRNYYLYIILLPITTIVINISKAIYAQRTYPFVQCSGKVAPDFVKEFCKRVFSMALSKIRTAVRSSIDSLAISSNLGLIALAQYQNYYQVMVVSIVVGGIVKEAMLPIYGNKVAVDNREDNYVVFKVYSFVNNWISTWCTVCMFCLMQDFISLWAGEENQLSNSVVVFFCVYYYIFSISENAMMIREATGEWRIGRCGAIIETMINIILNMVFVKCFGILGVLAATIIALICVNLPFEYGAIFKGYFNLSARSYCMQQMIYMINAIIICLITKAVCSADFLLGMNSFWVKIVICIMLPNVLYVGLNFYNKECKQVLCSIKKLWKKNS